MSNKIDTFVEEITIGDIALNPTGRFEAISKKTHNAALMAEKLSRMVLDLAEAVQRLDREGNTVEDNGRNEKIKNIQKNLKEAMDFLESPDNTNNYFYTREKEEKKENNREGKVPTPNIGSQDKRTWNRFKEIFLDKDVLDIEPGTTEAREFSRDCVSFSKFIKKLNWVPAPAAENIKELKDTIKNSLKSNKRGEDYNINTNIENLSKLYEKRDALIDKFNEILKTGNGGHLSYNYNAFADLKPETKQNIKKIITDIDDLENRIESIEKDEEKDYRLKARVAEKSRYNALRGKENLTAEHLNKKLTNSEKAIKYHKGLDAMGLSKLDSFNKGDTKILDLKNSPIDGYTDIRKLVAHWKTMGIKPSGQIEIVSTDGNGLGKVGKPIVNIKGTYYSVPRNHLITAAQGGIAAKGSEYKDYTKNLSYTGRSRAIAIKQGKVSQEEAGKYDDFRAKFSQASVVTEGYEDFEDSLHNLKMNGIFGKPTKKGIVIEYQGAKFLIPTDCSKLPKELRPFKKDIEVVFKNKTHGSMTKHNPHQTIIPPEPYKVGHRAQYLLKK